MPITEQLPHCLARTAGAAEISAGALQPAFHRTHTDAVPVRNLFVGKPIGKRFQDTDLADAQLAFHKKIKP